MLYPTNIKIEHKKKIQSIKEKLRELKNGIKRKAIYFIFDRSNLSQKIAIKLHI